MVFDVRTLSVGLLKDPESPEAQEALVKARQPSDRLFGLIQKGKNKKKQADKKPPSNK